VERCPESKFAKFFLVAIHGLAYFQRVASHALGMSSGLVISQIQGPAQCAQGFDRTST
jgi:hypothetical protein